MNRSQPKTVQIFLPDGNARSLRIAAVTSRTVQAIQIPRAKLKAAASRKEVRRVGVYFLVGTPEEDAGKPFVYVGEAEDCLSRLQEHHRSREFWTTAIAVTSKTMSFTKAHARYLEYDCIQKAKEADRYRLKNRAVPSEPHIPEPMLAELRDNFGTIQTLLSMLGYPILDPIGRQQAARILQCTGRGADATGEYTEDGLVVFKGSVIADSIVPSAHDTLTPRRANLREAGVIGTEGGSLQFLEDHAFNSPSGAAMVVLGRTANGWTQWTDEQGRTLDDLER